MTDRLMTMPNIPSASSIQMSGWGRNGDTKMAHVANGERIVPREVLKNNPGLEAAIKKAIAKEGADPSAYVVGSETGSYNPITGQQEFFLKKLKKLVGSSIGKILIPVAASILLPGLGTGLTAGMSAALGSAAATKIGGGSWGEALGAGLGSYVGGSVLSGMGPSVGMSLSNVGLNSLAGQIPASIAGASLGSIAGSFAGGSLGQALGGQLLGSSAKNVEAPASAGWGASIAPTTPNTTPAPSLALPGDNQNAVSAPTPNPTESGNQGAGAISNIGVSYLSPVKNRETGQTNYVSSPFGNNFGSSRRSGWGVAFA